MTVGIALYLDGTPVPIGLPGDPVAAPYVVDGLVVSWGRATTVDQPSSTCTFTLSADQSSADADLFGQTWSLGRRVDVDASPTSRVFTGAITDVSMVVPDDDPTGLAINVTCDDLLADLANRNAAPTPWPKETVAQRFDHVLGAARVGTAYTLAPDLAGINVRKAKADASNAAALLQDIAVSTDGVLWAIAQPGPAGPGYSDPYLWLESPGTSRAPLRRLAYHVPYVVIVDTSGAAGAVAIDPCLPDLMPIEFRQTMSDLVTGVTVTYYTPDPLDANADDVENRYTLVDPGAESPGRPWGARRMEIDSQLTSGTDATTTATKVLSRLSNPSWRLNNVILDNADTPDATMAKLLDSKTRTGLPVTIAPLPGWAPPDAEIFTGYVEGGNLTSTRGVWSAELWLSLAQGYAGASARWIDLPNPDLTARWTNSSSGSPAAAGLFRFATGARVIMPNMIDLDGVDRSAILSALTPGDIVAVYGGGYYWTGVVVTNTVRPGTDVQLAVTSETGVMPPLGVTAELSFTPQGDVAGPWRWMDFDPDISWADLTGVAGPIAGV